MTLKRILKLSVLAIFLFLAIIGVLFLSKPGLLAQLGLGSKPFGGKITWIGICEEGGTVITLSSGSSYFISANTKFYSRYVFRHGTWVLGLAQGTARSCTIAGIPDAPSGTPVKLLGTSGIF